MIYKQNMGETKNIFTDKKFIELGYLPIYNTGIQLDRIIIGNFTASFGQGVIMESTDYFSPRRSGYGYSKRNDGVKSDITRSSQYVLNGVAVQLSNNWMRLSYFRSKSPRDAIINKDLESFTSLIVMQPRLEWGINGDTTKIYSDLVSSVMERTMGWNVRLGKGANYLGFTFYRSLYDRIYVCRLIFYI